MEYKLLDSAEVLAYAKANQRLVSLEQRCVDWAWPEPVDSPTVPSNAVAGADVAFTMAVSDIVPEMPIELILRAQTNVLGRLGLLYTGHTDEQHQYLDFLAGCGYCAAAVSVAFRDLISHRSQEVMNAVERIPNLHVVVLKRNFPIEAKAAMVLTTEGKNLLAPRNSEGTIGVYTYTPDSDHAMNLLFSKELCKLIKDQGKTFRMSAEKLAELVTLRNREIFDALTPVLAPKQAVQHYVHVKNNGKVTMRTVPLGKQRTA